MLFQNVFIIIDGSSFGCMRLPWSWITVEKYDSLLYQTGNPTCCSLLSTAVLILHRNAVLTQLMCTVSFLNVHIYCQVATQSLYITSSTNMVSFPGASGVFNWLKFAIGKHYQDHGAEEDTLSLSQHTTARHFFLSQAPESTSTLPQTFLTLPKTTVSKVFLK